MDHLGLKHVEPPSIMNKLNHKTLCILLVTYIIPLCKTLILWQGIFSKLLDCSVSLVCYETSSFEFGVCSLLNSSQKTDYT